MVTEIVKSTDGQHSLVLWVTGNSKKYVICSFFDNTKPEGSMWSWGHYFDRLGDAWDLWMKNKYSERA